MCVSMNVSEWLVVCIKCSVCECVCVPGTRLLYVHTHLKGYFLWHDLNAHHIRGILISESCQFFSASNGSWCSGTRRTGEIRLPRETWDNHIPWKWQAGLTDWEEHVSNMPPYASDTFEKLAVKRQHCSWGSLHPAEICLTFKRKLRVCLLLHCIYRYMLWFIYQFLCYMLL